MENSIEVFVSRVKGSENWGAVQFLEMLIDVRPRNQEMFTTALSALDAHRPDAGEFVRKALPITEVYKDLLQSGLSEDMLTQP